jgi:hypothetical protein
MRCPLLGYISKTELVHGSYDWENQFKAVCRVFIRDVNAVSSEFSVRDNDGKFVVEEE